MLNKQWNHIKTQQTFESEAHNVYTEDINKIALSSNDDKRLQTFHKITSYSYSANVEKVGKAELLSKYIWLILTIKQMKTKQNII